MSTGLKIALVAVGAAVVYAIYSNMQATAAATAAATPAPYQVMAPSGLQNSVNVQAPGANAAHLALVGRLTTGTTTTGAKAPNIWQTF